MYVRFARLDGAALLMIGVVNVGAWCDKGQKRYGPWLAFGWAGALCITEVMAAINTRHPTLLVGVYTAFQIPLALHSSICLG
jgi:hypothetical protein